MKKWNTILSAALLASTGLIVSSSAEAGLARPLSDGDAARLSYSALQARAGEYGIRSATNEFRIRQVVRDNLRQTHVRMDQVFRGIPVFGEQLVTHFDAQGRLIGVNGTFAQIEGLKLRPTLSAYQALDIAMADFALVPSIDPKLELNILRTDEGDLHLAWRVELADFENASPAAWMYFIDAHSGDIVWDFDNLQTATAVGVGHSLYSGTVEITTNDGPTGFTMSDMSRGNQDTTDMKNSTSGNGVVFADADNEWGDGTNRDNASAGVDAHFGAAMTWDYYKNNFGRNGIRDDGRAALSRVHYSVNYVNAFWSDDLFAMTYGDGDGNYASPLVTLDVAGHEMTHGITSATAGLVYSGQSGGLNESMSDIFGQMVEFYAIENAGAESEGDYWIGEDCWTPRTPGDALRYMDNPSRDGRSIDNANRYRRGMDVHYSSGVSNNVFYLASEGGTNKTSGKKVPVGIGRDKAAAIFYQALTTCMTPRASWSNARKCTLDAARSLYGQAESDVMDQAWTACGVK